MSSKNAPEKICALANKFLDLADLLMIHETLIDRLVINVAEKATTVAEQAISKSEDTTENEFALKAAKVVVTSAKEQDEELEKLRAELVEKIDYDLLASPLGEFKPKSRGWIFVVKCCEFCKELMLKLRDIDGGDVADALGAKEPIIRKYTGETTNEEFLESALA